MYLKELCVSSFLEYFAVSAKAKDKDSESAALWAHQSAKARALENAYQLALEELDVLRKELHELQQTGGFQ